MRKLIYIIGLVFCGFTVAHSLGSFIDADSDIASVNAEYNENKRIKELSIRVDIDTYIDEKYIEDGEFDDESSIIYTDSRGSQYFKVEEFTKYDKNPTKETIRKIKEIHIPQLVKVRDGVNQAVIIRSAARSKEHELAQGRSGKSQHVYENGLGAVDVSLINYTKPELDKLENVIIDSTNYNRVTRYDTFIHVDYADNRFGDRAYYRNTIYGWIYIGKIK